MDIFSQDMVFYKVFYKVEHEDLTPPARFQKMFSHGIPMILLLIGKGIAVSLQGSLAGTLENLFKKKQAVESAAAFGFSQSLLSEIFSKSLDALG